MPIEMPRGLPFSVDTWSPASRAKRYHFLTHAHKDHSTQIAQYASYPIYATRFTISLVLQQFPQVRESLFVEIEVGHSVVIDDPDGSFSVSAFDANHCPGAVMFLFEGGFGNVLHTGDCRLTSECLQKLPMKYLTKKNREPKSCIDYLFLDCTFGKHPLTMPSRYAAVRQVINCIWKHPNAPKVYLACDMLGQEEILVEVYKTFGSGIYINRSKNEESFRALMLIAPHIISEDPSSRFQLFQGFPKLYERANAILSDARADLQPEPLFLRPSAQWYACDECFAEGGQIKLRVKEAEKDQFGVWHVCYSMHSSKEELEWALELLQPKWVVSTTPTCRAMELDYVKKKCFSGQITSLHPMWKLLNITIEESCSQDSGITDVSAFNGSSSKVMERNHSESNRVRTESIGFQSNLSPPCYDPPITLFGRARLGPQCFNLFQEEKKKLVSTDVFSHEGSSEEEKQKIEVRFVKSEHLQFQEEPDGAESEKDGLIAVSERNIAGEKQVEKSKDLKVREGNRTLDVNLRKLYRSMNVPVPRPLPSLLELMGTTRRARIKSLEG